MESASDPEEVVLVEEDEEDDSSEVRGKEQDENSHNSSDGGNIRDDDIEALVVIGNDNTEVTPCGKNSIPVSKGDNVHMSGKESSAKTVLEQRKTIEKKIENFAAAPGPLVSNARKSDPTKVTSSGTNAGEKRKRVTSSHHDKEKGKSTVSESCERPQMSKKRKICAAQNEIRH